VRDGTARCAAHKVVEGSFADRRRGSRHERGYGAAWDRLRVQVLARDKGVCQEHIKAGLFRLARDVDHIRNRQAGGTDDMNNLQSLCRECHQAKTAREARMGRGGGQNSESSTCRTDLEAGILGARVGGVGGVVGMVGVG
jgi:5-methylcytosine-specific restriction protein A